MQEVSYYKLNNWKSQIVISIIIVLVINKNFKIMWIPITIDDFVKLHLQKNPNENEKVLRVRIEAALDDYNNGVKCNAGRISGL